MKHERAWYIPKGARRIAHKRSSAVAYLYEAGGQPAAVGFHGRAQKPDYRYRFRNEAQRERTVSEHFRNTALHEDAARKRREEAKAKPNRLEVGMILYSSWGYEQTNIDFYEVVEVPSKCFVAIEKIGSQRAVDSAEYGHGMAENVVPDPTVRTGEILRKRVQNGSSVRLASYASATPWDGKPKYCSWYA